MCKVVIFDLDNTLHYNPNSNCDQTLNDHIKDIIVHFKNSNIKVTLASLNSSAPFYLKRYDIFDLFDKVYCKNWTFYGAHKSDFFESICKDFDVSYSDLLLFDDNIEHCEEAKSLGMKTIQVDSVKLLQWDDINNGMSLF